MDRLVQGIQDEVGDGAQLPDLMVNTKALHFTFPGNIGPSAGESPGYDTWKFEWLLVNQCP